MMDQQQPAQDTIRPVDLLLELVADETEESDPALIHAIGRDTVETLQEEHMVVRPVYTGQQGGDFLVEVVTTVGQLAGVVWDHRAVIEEVFNDASTLATVATFIYTVVTHVKRNYERRVGHDESVARPIKITLELEGASLPLDPPNPEQVQAVLSALLEQYKRAHAPTHASRTKKLKIRHAIPRKRAAGKRKHGKK